MLTPHCTLHAALCTPHSALRTLTLTDVGRQPTSWYANVRLWVPVNFNDPRMYFSRCGKGSLMQRQYRMDHSFTSHLTVGALQISVSPLRILWIQSLARIKPVVNDRMAKRANHCATEANAECRAKQNVAELFSLLCYHDVLLANKNSIKIMH